MFEAFASAQIFAEEYTVDNGPVMNGGWIGDDSNGYNDYRYHKGDQVKVILNNTKQYTSKQSMSFTSTLAELGYAVNMQGGPIDQYPVEMSLAADLLNINVDLQQEMQNPDKTFTGMLFNGVAHDSVTNNGEEAHIGSTILNINADENFKTSKITGVALNSSKLSSAGSGYDTYIFDKDLNINITSQTSGSVTGIQVAESATGKINGNLNIQIDPNAQNSVGVQLLNHQDTFTVQGNTEIAANTAVNITNSLNGTAEFKNGFTAHGTAGEDSATSLNVNQGSLLINSSGAGKVSFTGTTSIGDQGGTIDMNLTTAGSQWNVTGVSQVTDLNVTNGAILNFMLNEINDKDPTALHNSMIQAKDVTLGLEQGYEGKIAINTGTSGFQFNEENKLVLIQSSKNGFKDQTGKTLNGHTNLSGMIHEIALTSTPSIARVNQASLSKDDFGLQIEQGETNDQLIAALPSKINYGSYVNSDTDALMDSSLAAYSAMFASSDLLMDSVIRSRYGQHKEGAFAAARAGRLDYDTRSDLSANIYSGIFGYSTVVNAAEIGAFVETGHVSYDTSTPVAAGNLNASGKQNYAGLGFYTNLALPVDGLHLTGYLKSGALNNDFKLPLAGRTEKFERTSMYWGAHLGSYYDFNIASVRTRTFVSYFYDGRDSEDYEIAGHDDKNGARFDYDTLNGHRVQVGTFAEYNLSQSFRPYVGLTYERTISAKAEGTATDNEGSLALNSSDLDGNTGIFSVGFTSANSTNDFSMEVGLNGYVGQREGVTGQIQANWKF